MTTITTLDIAKRLSQSFSGVQSLVRICTTSVRNSADCRTNSNISYNGISLVCGVFTNDPELESYTRFVHIPETNDTFTF